MKIYQPSNRADGYEAPEVNPFPLLHQQVSQKARREYIQSCLVEMARNKTLYVTDMLRSRSPMPDEIGMVIMGQRIDPVSHRQLTNEHIPRELAEYRVRLRSLNGSTIKWCTGMVEGEEIRKGNALGGADGNNVRFYRARQQWIDTEETDTSVSLRDAWIALKAAGKHCCRAKTESQQKRLWKYEEVKPEATTEEAPRRGRPRADAEARA